MNRLIGHRKFLKLNFLYIIRYYIAGISLALNPGFPFQTLTHSSNFSPKLRDKIRNGKPGFKASISHPY